MTSGPAGGAGAARTAPGPRGGGRLGFGLAVALSAIAASVIAAPGLWLRREALFFRDHTMAVGPLFATADALAASGARPAWDPTIWCGAPSACQGPSPNDPRIRLSVALARAIGAPVSRGVSLFVLGHSIAAAIGMALLARTLGASRPASLGGGLAFAFSGVIASGNEYVTILASGAWMPFVAATPLRAAASVGAPLSSIGWTALGAGALALALLGDAQFAILGCLAALALCLAGAGHARPSRRRDRIAALAGVVAAGALLAAPHLSPLAAHLPLSNRAGAISPEVQAAFSLPPARLLELVLPAPFGPVHPLRIDPVALDAGQRFPMVASAYAGVTAIALAASVLAGGAPGARPALAALAALFALGLALALGHNTPVHGLVHALPPFDRFRYPEKYLTLAALAVAPLAALGIDGLAAWRPERRRAAIAVAVGLVLAGAAAALASGQLVEGPLPRAASHAAALAGALALVVARAPAGAWRSALLALVAGLDVAIAARTVVPAVPQAYFERSLAGLAVLASERAAPDPTGAPPRVLRSPSVTQRSVSADALLSLGIPLDAAPQRFSVDTLWGRTPNLYGLEAFDAVAPLALARFDRLSAALERRVDLLPRIAALAGCRHVIAGLDHPIVEDPAFEGLAALPLEGAVVLRPRRFLGKAWLVGAARALPGPAAALEAALAPGFDPAAEVVLEGGASESGAPGSAGTVGAIRRGDDRLEIDLEAARPGWLVVADAWHPGWRATVDGAPAEIRPANGFARAVRVDAGRHAVVMAYEAPGGRLGTALGFAGAAAIALAALAAARRGAATRPCGAPLP